MGFAAVMFDLDGTLADSLADIAAAGNHMLSKLGRPTIETFRFRYLAGQGVSYLVANALETDEPNGAFPERSSVLVHELAHSIVAKSRGFPVEGITLFFLGGVSSLKAESRRARGVEWVRPTDLIARHGAALAGRGIDFEVELARRTGTPIATGARRLGERARRLPPLSAFGRGSSGQVAPSRLGVGMS